MNCAVPSVDRDDLDGLVSHALFNNIVIATYEVDWCALQGVAVGVYRSVLVVRTAANVR